MGRPAAKKTMETAYAREFRVAQNIKILMLKNRTPKAIVMELLNWSDTTMWRRLNRYPGEITLTELYALCDLWGVSIDAFDRDDPLGTKGETYAACAIP